MIHPFGSVGFTLDDYEVGSRAWTLRHYRQHIEDTMVAVGIKLMPIFRDIASYLRRVDDGVLY